MGELLLCNRPIAARPYYIEAISLNIYSLEELCYVIEHHSFLLDEGFFNEELLLWMEREVKAEELVAELRQFLQQEQSVTRLVELVLNETGYLPYEAGIKVIGQIREMQHKSVFERRKMRADRYVENKKYMNALLEYRRILQMEEECRKQPIVCGSIWHNQGTVFARLFLFQEARECFEKAYQYHSNVESIYEAMAACRYLGDEIELRRLAKQYGIGEHILAGLREKWERAEQSEAVMDTEAVIDTFFKEETELLHECPLEENAMLMQMLRQWKAEYQKNCR